MREAFDENSTKLRKSYSADAQKLLKEMDNYYGDVKESMIGKRLETFLLHFYRQHNQVADKPVLLQKNHAYEEVWGIS